MRRYLCLFLFYVFVLSAFAKGELEFKGIVISSEDDKPIAYATVVLENNKQFSAVSGDNGEFVIEAPAGEYKLSVFFMGYDTYEKNINLQENSKEPLKIVMNETSVNIDEVVVKGSLVGLVKKSAFNAVAIDTKALLNTSKNLSDAMAQLPGLKIRESGGVGSDMQLMLDGFSGKHIKIFIDGVPQDGAGTSFDINNIPAGFAERIEVYKGVVPVEFGTDAIGGVVNIVTNKKHQKNNNNWFADASYSYGSFNTHKSSINFAQTTKKGFAYEFNAFQNYSDNDYRIQTYVTEFGDDGISETTDKDIIHNVKRFNDKFHNESFLAKVGLVGKKYADRLFVNFAYSQFYKEIQTGVRQDIVFGDKHRKGYTLSPSLEYIKRDLFTKGLDVRFNAVYNRNITTNVDTASYKYNWYGDKKPSGQAGEQSYQYNESNEDVVNATFNAKYRLGEYHTFVFNNLFTNSQRKSRTLQDGLDESKLSDFTIPKYSLKNIAGISYALNMSTKWNMSLFGKHYLQRSEGPVSQSTDGIGDYISIVKKVQSFGYGAAATYFILDQLQAKVSYEKACRLPSTNELFGDEDLEAGRVDLNPETSDNFNFNLNYSHQLNAKNSLFAEFGLIYRNTKDYIKREIDRTGGMSYGIFVNHGKVTTKGYNASVRYNYSTWLTLGATFSHMDIRNKEKYVNSSSDQVSLTYNQRIPNMPYMFANFDLGLTFDNVIKKGNSLNIGYEGYYQHAFPLYWENIGNPDSKNIVPDQLSHNISLGYSIAKGRYNFSLECRNISNAKLYDNFSLQKAGRAFYGKVRVYFGNK